MKNRVVEILKDSLKKLDVKLGEEDIFNLIEIPKDYDNGDFAFPCFVLSKLLQKSPHEIGLKIRETIDEIPEDFEDIEVVGPYVNFFVNRKSLALFLLSEIKEKKDFFGQGNLGEGKKLIVEFSSPNIAKPFGIGHLRSTIIGNALANLGKFQNYEVIKLNYLGDWGTQFGKLIVGYKNFGDEKKLKKDPIKHLYEIYVKVNASEKYEDEAREWFKKLEEGNEEALILWRRFRELSLEEFKKIYARMGIVFTDYLGESMYNKKMEEVVENLKKKKLLEESEGAYVVNLEKYNLGVSLIQKSDGATLYATRDLASAISRKEIYGFDEMIYEVGQEQKLHFNQIFKILELMGYGWAKNCTHVDHGLYLGKDNKRLATRKGKTIFMEDVLDETEEIAQKEIKKRFPKLSKKELSHRGRLVALAAIFYGDLKNTRTNNIVFDLDKFVSFEGDTGPYMLYSYARASSILKKSMKIETLESPDELENEEMNLTLKLNEFKQVVLDAYKQKNPALVASYAYKLSQIFNEFYHACPVIGSKKEQFRLHLINGFRQVLKNGLNLLGIEVMEEM